MLKLLAVDLDGTLIKRDGEIDVRDLAAIERARAAGVVVTIVTGRLFAGTQIVAQRLGMDFPVACADGAQLVDPTNGNEIEHLGICGEAARHLHRTLTPRPVCLFLLYRDGVLHDPRGAPFRNYVGSWSPKLDEVDDLYAHSCWDSDRGLWGIVVLGPDDAISGAAQELRDGGWVDVFDFRVTHAPSGESVEGIRALLGHAAGVSKGAALTRLASRCGCHLGEVAAIGDWHNDVSMFAVAGRSFVMAHAPAQVRAAATDKLRADALSGGGVAEAIDQLL